MNCQACALRELPRKAQSSVRVRQLPEQLDDSTKMVQAQCTCLRSVFVCGARFLLQTLELGKKRRVTLRFYPAPTGDTHAEDDRKHIGL